LTSGLLLWSVVMLLGIMSPGPDFAIVVRNSIGPNGGSRGVMTAAGVAAGVFMWVFATAFGLIAVLAVYPVIFLAIRIAGAVYLSYLGLRALVAVFRRRHSTCVGEERDAHTTSAFAFRNGLICNLLNPKAAVWFIALLPQFLGSSVRLWHVLVLAAIAAVVALSWLSIVAMLVAAMRRFMSRPRVRRTIDAATGVALLLCGVRVAVTA
jgi:threonine/homoserine/homoserine lactone efflux protein